MIKDAVVVFKLLFKSMFGDRYKNNKRFSPKVAGILLALLLAAYFAFLAFSFSFGTSALDGEHLVAGTFVAVSQIAVLMLGIFAAINILYFSKDTMLLSSLPVRSSAIFLAKIVLIYICELGISTIIALPSLLTIGIYRAVTGIGASVGYFVYSVLSVFFIPVLPLLIVSLFSMPLMYFVSYLKKHGWANVAFSVLLGAVMIGIVLAMQIYVNSGSAFKDAGDEASMAMMLSLHQVINKICIFNYPLRMALSVGNGLSVLWFLAYVGIALLGVAVSVLISSKLYGKILLKGLEVGSSNTKKDQGELQYKALSFRKTFVKKELRTFITTPALFVNFLLPVVVLPIVCIIMSFSIGQIEGAEAEGFDPSFISFPMMMYVAVMITCFSNFLALVGFSREGKNFLTLKTLPVSAREIVRLKSALALSLNVILSIVAGGSVIIGLVVGKSGVWFSLIAGLGTLLICLIFGSAYDLIALSNDMKKLNVSWQNLSEITKKNPNIVGVQLLVIAVTLVMMVVVILVSVFLSVLGWDSHVVLALSLSICILISLAILAIAIKKINKNPEKWLDEVEI